MAIYVRYALPSLRCHLTVHNLHKIHMEELDLIAQSYIKKWLGIPARGGHERRAHLSRNGENGIKYRAKI